MEPARWERDEMATRLLGGAAAGLLQWSPLGGSGMRAYLMRVS